MAEEKPRAPRARKKTTEADKEAVVGKASAKRSSGTKAAASAAKATTKKKRTPAAPRAERSRPMVVEPGDVALLAYLLWERGELGDAAEHWLRAEQELQAA